MSANTPTIVEVEETLTGRYMQTTRTGHHALTVDEPKAVGGNDAGPGPYEYLLIGLGACSLSHLKIHAQDCADCETREGSVDEITREIRLEGDLTEEQREQIANRCPVHRTLTSEIKVHSCLSDDATA
ncbi:MAG: OsmC family protein [Pseudomonadota bacterium]|nr:OsmC family protein [Pseudomonadota bacterium]